MLKEISCVYALAWFGRRLAVHEKKRILEKLWTIDNSVKKNYQHNTEINAPVRVFKWQ